ncbi:acyl carrier protein [Acetivibrio straminisolvens]|jgi:acyl carrier protein|uniref:acyl carrier protein n=1 Tax=Acetivibrio straminisolvens TaxID=253314 RepID=UPI00223E92A7|nr:acyl carrier protein [Acetivibrio straminisolvens]HOV25698.1 acyl carrier protein [Pseudobacteroides sp.]
MIFKSNYEKVVISILKEIASDENINKDTNIQKDIYIDSMGWLQFLIKLEKKLKCNIEPNFLAKGNYETVEDLVNGIKSYIDSK